MVIFMIDFGRWIYSEDIAVWAEKNTSLNLEEQIACICAAPHRTLEEKLEGVKELKSEHDGKPLQDQIENMKMVLQGSRSDTRIYMCLFGIEIFFRGEKDCFLPYTIFRSAGEAINGICYHIEKAAKEEHLERRNWCGVVRVFRRSGKSPHGYVPIKNTIVRYDGEVIYVQNIYGKNGGHTYEEIDMGYFEAVKVPYSSGTIISIPENPYIPALKGVLVNMTEPDEGNFPDGSYDQWLIYPTRQHRERTHGIGFVNLRDDYIPFENSPDFIFPYKKLMTVYKGDLKEDETWMSELSALIQADKNCIRKILHDREPKDCRYIAMNDERLKYVRELSKKTR